MIETVSFSSTNPWKHTLILWSIHGNEVCGSIAIDRVAERIRSWSTRIISGQVTFLPRANRKAYDKWVREIEYNLNRLFGPRKALSEEHQITKLIEGYINNATFVLDLHSIHEGEGAFAFQESPIEVAKEVIAWLPVSYFLLDWERLYGETTAMDTIAYATSRWIPWVTVECGNHTDPKSIEIAEESINHTLAFLGHVDPATRDYHYETRKLYVKAKEIIYRPAGAKFTKDWKNFDVIRKWEVLWTADEWEYTAPYDGMIIIPKPVGKKWDEWYYLGTAN